MIIIIIYYFYYYYYLNFIYLIREKGMNAYTGCTTILNKYKNNV